MASSVVAAALARFDTLDATLFPGGVRCPRYFAAVPLVDGVQVRPPYAVLFDDSAAPEPFEAGRQMHTARLRWECLAAQLVDADAIANAVCWNGQVNAAGAGFDYGTLDVTGFAFNTMRLVWSQRTAEQRTAQAGGLVHKVTLRFEAELEKT